MGSDSIPMIVTLVILIFLSAFFSSAETALTMVSRTKMIAFAEEGKIRAAWVLKLIDNPSKLLSTILIGNNIVNLSASAITTTLAAQIGGYATGIGTGILTLVILIFGEITPKTLATTKSESMSMLYSPVILFLFYVLTPVIWILNAISNAVFFIIRIDPEAKKVMSERELRYLVEESHEDGVIEKEEKLMINNVFDFGDTKARDVMTPRIDVVTVDVTDSYETIIKTYDEHHYTRMPVMEDNHVIGVLNIKDLLFELSLDHDVNLRDILWTPYFTTEFQKTSDLLAVIREADSNMAIILDEYGATAGIVTMEDLLEEIVGELRDEYDQDEEKDLVKVQKNVYEVDGSMRLDDLNDSLELDITSDEYESIGGHIIELLDHFPKEGEQATEYNLRFTVLEMD
ncbi:MAG: hemolysin family protein, partial [Lachnospiraceae bacterium]|nr:hemolysin family protein [Lachnospiraceae bacterium]